MQMAYTALQAWFLGSQVLAAGKGMREAMVSLVFRKFLGNLKRL
jgi:hypothetical protein